MGGCFNLHVRIYTCTKGLGNNELVGGVKAHKILNS